MRRSLSQSVDYSLVSRTLAQTFDAAVEKVRLALEDNMDRATVQLVAADPELLNIVITSLQLLNGLVVRLNNPSMQGEHYDGLCAEVVKKTFDLFHIRLYNANPTPAQKEVSDRLKRDIRVNFFLSLLLRDIAQLDYKREAWVWFTRRPIYLAMLTDTARAAVALADHPTWQRDDKFAEPREPGTLATVVKTLTTGGQGYSPISVEKKHCTTGRVFENLFIAMRTILLTSAVRMRTEAPSDEPFDLPEGSLYPSWDWRSQDLVELHREAGSWAARIVAKHASISPTVLEGVRYIGAIASMQNLPGVTPEMIEAKAKVAGVKPLVEIFDLNDPAMIEMTVNALQRTTHVEIQVVAACIAGNLLNYQRPAINAFHRQSTDNVQGMADVLTGCLSVLTRATALQDPLRSSCILYTLRAVTTFLTLEAPKLVTRVLQGNVLSMLSKTFAQLYSSKTCTLSDKDFSYILHSYSVILRNLATIGVAAMTDRMSADEGNAGFKSDPLTDAIEENLGFAPLITLFLNAIYQLNDAPTPLINANQLLTEMRENLLETLKTLLRYEQARAEIAKFIRIDWSQVNKIKLESQLIVIHETWVEETEGRDGAVSERFALLLYMMTRLGFTFMRRELPDLLAGVAYRPDIPASERIKEICAASSALLAASGGSSKTSGQMKELLTRVAAFIQHAAQIKDDRQRLWHYRMAAEWTQIPNVIKQIVEDEISLSFVFDTLMERSFSRYSILVVHNLSVFAAKELLMKPGLVIKLCETYTKLVEDPGFLPRQKERPMLTRWLMAAMRNIFLSPQKIADEPPFDKDFAAFLALAPVVDNFDAGLYFNTLLRMSDEWVDCRPIILHSAAGEKIFEALLRPGKFSLTPLEVLPYSFDPKAMKSDDPDAVSLVEKKANPGIPGKKKGLWHSAAASNAKEMNASKEVQGIGSGKDGVLGFVREYILFMASHLMMNCCYPPETKLTPEQEASLFPWEKKAADEQRIAHENRVSELAEKDQAVQNFYTLVEMQASAHQQKKVVLSDFYLDVTSKVLLFFVEQPILRKYMSNERTLSEVTSMAPFYLSRESSSVRQRYAIICLRMELHRKAAVTHYLQEYAQDFPSLATALLSRALVDHEAEVALPQCVGFMKTLLGVCKDGTATPPDMQRIFASFTIAVSEDRPPGIQNALIHTHPQVCKDIIAQFSRFAELASAKKAICVIGGLTIGSKFQDSPSLDSLVLEYLRAIPRLLDFRPDIVLPTFHRISHESGDRLLDTFSKDLKLHILLQYKFEALVKQLAETGEDPKNSVTANQARRVLVIFAGFLLVAGDDGGLARTELISPMLAWLKMTPHWIDVYVIMFILSYFANSAALRQHVPKVLDDIVTALPQLVEAKDATDDLLEIPEVPGLQFPSARVMMQGLYRNMCLLCVQLCNVEANHAAFIKSRTPFDFLVKVGHPQGPLWQNSLGPYATLSCFMALANSPANHPALYQMDFPEQLCIMFENLFAENIGGTITLIANGEGDPARPPHGEPKAFTFEELDLRLFWIRSVTAILASDPLKVTSNQKKLLGYALDVLITLIVEYRLSTQYLAVVLEVYPRFMKAMMSVYEYPAFAALRERFTLMLMLILCRAISPRHREVACAGLTTICADPMTCQQANGLMMQSTFNYVCAQIIVAPATDLSIEVCKLIANCCKNGGHSVREYFRDECLVHLIPVMMDPKCPAGMVYELARIFYFISTDLSLSIISPVMDLPNLAPFIALAKSSYASRRDLVKDWLEFFGLSFAEAPEVLVRFQESTDLGFIYMATQSSLERVRSTRFRSIIFHIAQDRFNSSRMSADPIRAERMLSESHCCQLVEMCASEDFLVEAFCKMAYSLVEPPAGGLGEGDYLSQFWQAGKCTWFVQILRNVEAGAPGGGTFGGRPSTWKHEQLFRVHAMIIFVCARLCERFKDATMFLLTQSKMIACALQWCFRYCHEQIPELVTPLSEPVGTFKGTSQDLFEAAVVVLYELLASLGTSSDEATKRVLLEEGGLEFFIQAILPTPVQHTELLEQLKTEEPLRMKVDVLKEGHVRSGEMLIAKKLAGSALAGIFQTAQARKTLQSKAMQSMCERMVLQVVSWEEELTDFGAICERGDISTRTTQDRCLFLYLVLISRTTIEWMLDRLGLRLTAQLQRLLLKNWRHHPISTVSHLSMRMVATMAASRPLWANLLFEEDSAQMVHEALRRSMRNAASSGQVRELRHATRYMVQTLCHVFAYPLLPKDMLMLEHKLLRVDDDGAPLYRKEKEAAILIANRRAAEVVLRVPVFQDLLQEMLELQQEDVFSQSWSLWIALMFMSNSRDGPPEKDPEIIIELPEVNFAQRFRRAEMQGTDVNVELHPATTHLAWVGAGETDSLDLATLLVQVVCKALAYPSELPETFGCLVSSWILSRVPRVLPVFVANFLPKCINACFGLPYPMVHASSLLMVSMLTSMRLPMLGATVEPTFLKRFFSMQAQLLQSFAEFSGGGATVQLVPHPTVKGKALPGETMYSLVFRFFYFTQSDPVLGPSIRAMAAYVLGQCLMPPRKNPPALSADAKDDDNPPVVACPEPPFELLELLANTVMDMDRELVEARANFLYTTAHCHVLYALAYCVTHHARGACQSAATRGAALSQLMKVQRAVSNDVDPKTLYDADDEDDAMIWMYIRSSACVRAALQSVLNAWLNTGYGSRFAAEEEGGVELCQFLIKHVLNAYNGQTKLKRAMGNPWEHAMIELGPTPLVTQLFLMMCGAEQNLRTLTKLGGEKAVHNLSRYADDQKVRQQATVLLTKVAVLNNPAAQK
jgi:hypothetical protein